MIPDEIKLNGKSIGYLKGYKTGIYGSLRDLVGAYGGKITSKKNVYTATVNGVTMKFDLNNKKIGDTYSFTIIKNGNKVSTAFSGYYKSTNGTNKVTKRYTRFQYNQFGTTDKETIRNYVDDYVKGGWYIMSDYKKRGITDEERNALRDAFVNFIVNENVGK